MPIVLYEIPDKFDCSFLQAPIVIIVFTLIFAIVVKKLKIEKAALVSSICLIGIGSLAFFYAVIGIAQFTMYSKTAGAYRRGEYETVEGCVENFDPMPYHGKKKESFEIGGVKFFYSDYNDHPGYHRSRSHGGVIKGNGQRLKIGYVYVNETYGNIIVYIEHLPE
ncbi:MAG: hypothetical protein IKM00_09315 [Clostridia bacterium]|nr:hypothetical protein [Clostridia bacterium]